jgi:A/G-specific adenine glycosylase
VAAASFSQRIIEWQTRHGRHGLPWQSTDVYHTWVSEIMLQQTQVATVIPYYRRFIETFPDIATLAAASQDAVLAHWSGLGYYARGRNLHRAAKIIQEKYNGEFPHSFDDIVGLPGIGRSTAAAICALARHERRAILDGNVKRVLARHLGIEGWPGEKQVGAHLWQQSETLLPQQDVAVYTQGLMDLGSSICTRSKPKCADCPVRTDCTAQLTGRAETLPSPRPKKEIPYKCASLLLLMQGNEILLEKRPPSGVWGGLWCLPQFDDEPSALAWCARHGMSIANRMAMPEFTHTFTHFRLRIAPLRVDIGRKPLKSMEPGMVWLNVEKARHAPIPAPVRGLLEQLALARLY